MGNKPIRKQVPVDSPMRGIGWDPIGSGGGPEPSGPVQVKGGITGHGKKSIQSESWVLGI